MVHSRSFEKAVVPVAQSEGLGILGMKSMEGALLKSNTVAPTDYLRYALSLPTSVVITGINSMDILNQNLNTARNFKPLTRNEVQELLANTRQRCRERRVRTVQNHFTFRFHRAESEVARRGPGTCQSFNGGRVAAKTR